MKQSSTILNTTNQYYESIDDMPIYNWNKIMETGNLKWIFINGGTVTKKIAIIWENLQNQYFDEFGLDSDYRKKLRLMKEIVRLNDEFIQTGDRFLLNLINIAEIDLKGIEQQKSFKFYDLLDRVITIKKIYIDPKTYPVKLWFYTLKNIADGKAN